jgi:phosphoglycolate phosphatase-like HAD superfamily hydrolase
MGLEAGRIKALCFDVDGTLSDTDDQFVQNLVRILNPIRFVFPRKDPRPFARKFVMKTESPGNYLYGLPDRYGFDSVLASLGDRFYRVGLGRSKKPFLLIPGIKDMLEVLRPHYKMSVVSARGARSTQRFINQFDLTDYFDVIVTAQTCEYTKPYPDPIRWAAGIMGVNPGDCLMVGDTTVDILAAVAAGAQSVGVLCGFGEREELVQSGADLILENTSMLPEKLVDSAGIR